MKHFFLRLSLTGLLAATLHAQTNVAPAAVSTNTAPERLESVQIDLANGFLGREFYDLALAEYRKYLEWFPKGGAVEEAQYRIADCMRGLGNADAAREQYQLVQKTFPNGVYFARAAFRIGEMDWDAEHFAEALPHFVEAAETAEGAETRLTARFYQARTLMQLKKNAEAIPVLQEIAKVEKQNPYRGFALLEMARAMETAGNEDESRILYARVLDTDAAPLLRAEAGLKAGALEMKAKHWAAAILDFEKVRKLNVASEWITFANHNMVRSCYQADQHDAVVRLLEDSKNQFPKNAQAELDLLHAHSYRQLKKYKEAIQWYDIFLKNNPGDASAESASYERLISLHLVNAAAWDAEAVAFLKTFPDAAGAPQVLYLQADRAFRKKDFATAATIYSAIPLPKMTPAQQPEIVYRLGVSQAQVGKFSEAAATFADFIKRFPGHALAAGAFFQKGHAEQQLGKFETALGTFKELVGEFPKAAEREGAIYRMALMQGELKQYAAMRDSFQLLAREYPKNPFVEDAAYWIGWSLFEEKKYAEALPGLQQARKAKPADYGAQATSRIILSEYYLGQRAALLKEMDALPADFPLMAPDLYDWLARQSAKENDQPSAEKYFRKLIAHPNGAAWKQASRWELAASLAAQAKWKQAVETWEAYEKDYTAPADIVATKLELVRGHLALKNFARAQEIAEDVLRLQPEGKNNAQARFLLGEIMAAQKKFADAGKYYLSVAVLYEDPDLTPKSLSRAITAFESAGETNQVTKLKQELKTKFPNYK